VPATLKLTHKAIGAEVRRGTYDALVDGKPVASVEMNDTIQALDLAHTMDYHISEGFALHNLGESYRAIGDPVTAADCFRRALSVREHAGHRLGQAQSLRALGDLLQELREADAAHASWRQALTIFEELGDPQAGELRARLWGSKTGISS